MCGEYVATAPHRPPASWLTIPALVGLVSVLVAPSQNPLHRACLRPCTALFADMLRHRRGAASSSSRGRQLDIEPLPGTTIAGRRMSLIVYHVVTGLRARRRLRPFQVPAGGSRLGAATARFRARVKQSRRLPALLRC
jgi:hypothetical protein